LGDDVFQFHTPPRYATGLDIRCPCEKIYAAFSPRWAVATPTKTIG
jgi:hypothetical protein